MPYKDKEVKRRFDKIYAAKRREHLTRLARLRSQELKSKVYSAYGNQCSCCGEEEREFLQLDHINNDGNEDRRLVFKGRNKGNYATFYRHVLNLGCPKSLYQLLCANCNWAKRCNSVCPHERKR